MFTQPSKQILPGQEPAYDRFFAAVQSGDVDRVRDSLISSLNLDALLMHDDGRPLMDGRGNGKTALHMASEAGNAEIVAFLLSRGASVDSLEMSEGVPYPPDTPLFEAAYFNHVAVVRVLLEHGADINVECNMDCNPVHQILFHKKVVIPEHFELFRTFLEFGQDINAVATDIGGTVLHQAVEIGDTGLIKFLWENGAELNSLPEYEWSPLSLAVRHGNLAVTRYLLECGAKVDENALVAARGVEILDLLCQNTDHNLVRNCRALYFACGGRSPSCDIIAYLLRMDANIEAVDKSGNTPLLYACGRGDAPPDVIELLLQYGAHPLARRTKTGTNEESVGDSALHQAAFLSRPRTIQLLLAAGVDPNMMNEMGQTAIMKCAFFLGHCNYAIGVSKVVRIEERLECLRILKDAGADGTLRDHGNRTPLHYLAMTCYLREKLPERLTAAEILLQAGSEFKAMDTTGKTAKDLFAEADDHEMVDFLSQQECTK